MTLEEAKEMILWAKERGRSAADVVGDIEALNRARGGSGSFTCEFTVDAPAPGEPLPDLFDVVMTDPAVPDPEDSIPLRLPSCEDQLAEVLERIQQNSQRLKELESEMLYWQRLELMPEYRWAAYLAEVLGSSQFDPVSPEKMDPVIDRKWGSESLAVLNPETGMYTFGGPLWEQSPNGQKAKAEKEAYRVWYQQRMEKLKKLRELPKSPADIRQFTQPAQELERIGMLQDDAIRLLRLFGAKADLYRQRIAEGGTCDSAWINDNLVPLRAQ